MEEGLRVEPMSFDLARPVSVGDEWIYFESAAFLGDADTPLLKGQYFNIGGELRLILEVGERVVKVTAVEENHHREEYVYRPGQMRIGEDWYRLVK
jgi:hypothetical protein